MRPYHIERARNISFGKTPFLNKLDGVQHDLGRPSSDDVNMRRGMIVNIDHEIQTMLAMYRRHAYTSAMSGASSAFIPITL